MGLGRTAQRQCRNSGIKRKESRRDIPWGISSPTPTRMMKLWMYWFTNNSYRLTSNNEPSHVSWKCQYLRRWCHLLLSFRYTRFLPHFWLLWSCYPVDETIKKVTVERTCCLITRSYWYNDWCVLFVFSTQLPGPFRQACSAGKLERILTWFWEAALYA
jgi:hypothetical protein